MNLPSLLNLISNISPLKKISYLGSFTFCSNFDDVVSEASAQYQREYIDFYMYSNSTQIRSILFN